MSITAAARRPLRRYVEHVMGMPVSLALRGRHAATEEGRAAWAAVMTELAEVELIFSTYRTDSVISGLDRGELDLAHCPAEVAELLALAERASRESGGAFSTSLPTPGETDGCHRLDPSGVVKSWAAERAARHLARLDDTDFCLSAGGDITCCADGHSAPWRIGIETRTARPGSSPWSRCATVRSPRPAPRTAAPTSSTPGPGLTSTGVAWATVVAPSLT